MKKTERPHPLTPFIRGWLVFLALAFGLGRPLLEGRGPGDGGQSVDLGFLSLAVALVVLLAAAAGFVSWYFTRFVIDDDELRVETGAVFRSSRKVPFERLQSIDLIQPLAARMFGLAELRIEVGAGDATVKLRYLGRARASRLRDYLLARATGERSSVHGLQNTAAASALTDLGGTDRPLVVTSPQRIIGGFLLSADWLFTVGIAVLALGVGLAFDVTAFALPGLIPLVIGGVTMVSRRVIGMYNFTLAETGRGLRVTRGLTNLTSQTVPVDRVQGVKISQPLLWRRVGWYRLDVDIASYGLGAGDDNDSNPTSVLLPVATAEEVALALGRVLPDADPDTVPMHPAPRRVRWVEPVGYRALRYGTDDRVIVTEQGVITRVRNIVPHAKTQSVRITQGPLQRRLRLADVHVDTPRGPVNAVARELDDRTARELALSQLDRARAARRRPDDRRTVTQPRNRGRDQPGMLSGPDEDAALLHRFGLGPDALVGQGGESRVYALAPDRVLRIYKPGHEAAETMVRQLRDLYGGWAGVPAPVEVPLILHTGTAEGRWYTVDRRMSGVPFSPWLADAEPAPRRQALLSYLDVAGQLSRLPAPQPGWARLLGEDPRPYESLFALLTDQLTRRVRVTADRLSTDLPGVEGVWDRLQHDLAARQVRPALVHGDYCPPNVYLSRAPDGRPVVTGVGDFSPHTLVADPMMDVAGAVGFLELEDYPGAFDDAAWLADRAEERFGPGTSHWIGVYRRYFAFYFSDAYDVDPRLYAWCLAQLRTG